MTTRRTFLRLLGIGAPAAAVATTAWPRRAVTREQLQAEYPDPHVYEPSYSDIGTEPDLQSLIYDVPPTETPLMRQVKRI